MHENREISRTPWSAEQGRSAKAINRTADTNVREKSDCAVVPVNQPNNEGQVIVPFDIFSGGNHGEALWLGSAETLAQAVKLMRDSGEGVYFVFSQKSSDKRFYKVAGDSRVSSIEGP
jgi:hypothetical protein